MQGGRVDAHDIAERAPEPRRAHGHSETDMETRSMRAPGVHSYLIGGDFW
jgi:hypothetical protein